MWYIMTWTRCGVCVAVALWGCVQAMLNLGFDTRSPWGPLIIAAVVVWLVKPDSEEVQRMRDHARRAAMLADDAARKARAAHT